MRELDGVSARERWDRIRAQSFVEQFGAEIQRMLEGVRLDLGCREVNAGNLFDALLTALRSARRREGWTRTELAWKHGFRHHGRLNLAVFRRFGVTVQQLETEMLKEILKNRKTQSAMCMFRSEFDAPEHAPPSFESPGPESHSPEPESLPLLPPRIAADPVWAERFRTSGHPLLQPRAFQSAAAALKAFKKEGFTERDLDYLIRRGHIPPLEAYVA
ncbi:MAG: hypothetical protein HY291_23905 [Planctomycetes bacterium]|nr:hypothetical protein [Planctomycetota bacterium]